MDVNSDLWSEYEARFWAVAEKAQVWEGQRPNLADAFHYLCLYGENGLSPQAEFDLLAELDRIADPIYRIEVETNYWQETILYVPPKKAA